MVLLEKKDQKTVLTGFACTDPDGGTDNVISVVSVTPNSPCGTSCFIALPVCGTGIPRKYSECYEIQYI